MYILGISAYYHDSAAALLKDGEVVAAAQEERFSRIKNDPSFPRRAILFCLQEAGIALSAIDIVVFYDKPFMKFERILETFYRHAPLGFKPFLKGIPIWIKEKMFFKQMLRKELRTLGRYDETHTRLLFTEHHLAHAASAFFASPYEKAAILTVDGVGEWATLSLSLGKGNKIEVLKEMHFPDSIGLFYSAFTYYLGFRVNSGEYKLMGLAPYGDRSSETTLRFAELIKERLVRIHPDGSITLNQAYFNYQTGLTMVKSRKWEKLFGFPRRKPETDLLPAHCSLACAAQIVTEEILLKLVHEARKETSATALCLAGGVALNCVANGRIIKEKVFDQLFIQPAAGDSGGALGAALAAYYIHAGKERTCRQPDRMKGALLGSAYTDAEIRELAEEENVPFRSFDNRRELCRHTARLLARGNCIGWFQGRMEFGPRALGNRSILADPRYPEMQQRVNLKIKFRESFRPFAPAILKEEAASYFDCLVCSDYMLLTAEIRDCYKKELPPGYADLEITEKRRIAKSDYPSITHVDYSSRLQTVDRETNPLFWSLLTAFKEQTGCPMLINTSFNVRGEPIVCSPADAFRCFMTTDMDYLVMENIIFDKKQCKT
ncbi:carbamoyltransferase family protein [Parabacteroides faecis]|uniref:carbamoyltransferase family protein n=1 Tax=Parabacteroides faecis TaxID=1217282 RepID=UPI003522D023